MVSGMLDFEMEFRTHDRWEWELLREVAGWLRCDELGPTCMTLLVESLLNRSSGGRLKVCTLRVLRGGGAFWVPCLLVIVSPEFVVVRYDWWNDEVCCYGDGDGDGDGSVRRFWLADPGSLDGLRAALVEWRFVVGVGDGV